MLLILLSFATATLEDILIIDHRNVYLKLNFQYSNISNIRIKTSVAVPQWGFAFACVTEDTELGGIKKEVLKKNYESSHYSESRNCLASNGCFKWENEIGLLLWNSPIIGKQYS